MFKFKKNKNIQNVKTKKLAITSSYLAQGRKIARPETPLGFRSRTSVSFYNSYNHRIQ